MNIARRQALSLSAGAMAAALGGFRVYPACAAAEDADKRISEFTGGAAPQTGKITLTAPEIAENGYTVPITISVESAMTGDDLVESVMIVADGNPNPEVATFHFTELSGSASATTRMRLAKTQNIVAVAKMKDGSTFMDKKEIKVTIGGCGG